MNFVYTCFDFAFEARKVGFESWVEKIGTLCHSTSWFNLAKRLGGSPIGYRPPLIHVLNAVKFVTFSEHIRDHRK